jgi:hypothetical protein
MSLRTGYGTATFGSSKYGLPEVYDGKVSDSVTASATASAQRVALAAAAADAAVSPAVSGVRVQSAGVNDTSIVTASAAGFTALAGSATSAITTSVDLYWNRVRPFSAQDNITIGADVKSRYKWNNIAPPTTSWADSNYREGAA